MVGYQISQNYPQHDCQHHDRYQVVLTLCLALSSEFISRIINQRTEEPRKKTLVEIVER